LGKLQETFAARPQILGACDIIHSAGGCKKLSLPALRFWALGQVDYRAGWLRNPFAARPLILGAWDIVRSLSAIEFWASCKKHLLPAFGFWALGILSVV
jgi:hypothetical protein